MSIDHRQASIESPLLLIAVPSEVRSFASAKGIEAELGTMLHGTREIFGGEFRVVLEEDAEIRGDVHLLFEARASGDVDRVLSLEDEWHQRCISSAPKAAPYLRLFVDIQ